MAKVTPVLWTPKKNGKGLSPIYLRIEAANKRRYLSLGQFVKEADWNPKQQQVRKSHDEHERINNLIQQRLADASRIIIELSTDREVVTADALKKNLALAGAENAPAANSVESCFFVFADSIVDDLEARGQVHTHRRYQSIVKRFAAFAGRPLPYNELKPALLREYETYLIQKRKNKAETVASNFRCIRAIAYRAIREGHLSQSDNPFFHFKIKRGKANRTKLSLPELRRIEALELEPDSWLWHVRNYYLFSVYAAGIRFGDLCQLTRANIGVGGGTPRLSYTMGKTKAAKTVKLPSQALEILENYPPHDGDDLLFPLLRRYDRRDPKKLANAIASQNTLVNRALKDLAEAAKIDKPVTFHTSRHSFADIARSQGIDVYVVSKMLGHTSLKITEEYLKDFDEEATDAATDQLWGAE